MQSALERFAAHGTISLKKEILKLETEHVFRLLTDKMLTGKFPWRIYTLDERQDSEAQLHIRITLGAFKTLDVQALGVRSDLSRS